MPSLKKGMTSHDDCYGPILPGLPDDVVKLCLALAPRTHFSVMASVSRNWRSFIRSKEFVTVRKRAGVLEEWLYVLMRDDERKESYWEVLDCNGNKLDVVPPMPGGGVKTGFGAVVVNGKLVVVGGCDGGDCGVACADAYQYDSCLNSWTKLASMNTPRYDFACAELGGLIYAAGGRGEGADCLATAEIYDPDTDTWTLIEPLRRPRWGCFAFGSHDKLYVMGGRSSFTIGNSKIVNIYNPENRSWSEIRKGCVMVTAHEVLGNNLFCMEWKNQRKLSIFNTENYSWNSVPIPVTGSSSIGFRFGKLDGKLLLFPTNGEPGYRTLVYDPNAVPGSEWKTSDIRPDGCCLLSVTIGV